MRRFENCVTFLTIALALGCQKGDLTSTLPSGTPTASSGGSTELAFSGLKAIDQITDTSVRVHWNTYPEALGYFVYEVSGSDPQLVKFVAAPQSSLVIDNLAPDTAYTFRVNLYNKAGMTDENHVDWPIRTALQPNQFSPLIFAGITSTDNLTNHSVTLRWAVQPDVLGYFVYNSAQTTPQLLAFVKAPTNEYTVKGLLPNTPYKFRVNLLDPDYKIDNNTHDVSVTTSNQTTPPDISNLVLWLRADVGVIKDGSNKVTQWQDQSPSNAHVTQAVASEQPTYDPIALSGLPAIRFDGSNDRLLGPSVITGTGGRTFFVVLKRLSTPNTYNVPFDLSRSVTGKGTNFAVTSELAVRISGNRVFNEGSQNGLVSLLEVRSATGANVTTVQGWVNGTPATEKSHSAAAINTNSTGIYVGQAAFTSASNCHCEIAEIVAYHRELSESERLEIESYLMTKYSIP